MKLRAMDLLLFSVGVVGVVGAVVSRPKPPKVDLPVGASSDVIRRALAIVGLTQQQAAYLMGIDEFELSRQLTTRGVNSARLKLLGPEFQRVYGLLLTGADVARATAPPAPPCGPVCPTAARVLIDGLIAGHLAQLAAQH